jgi:hypothetical protein
VTQVAVDAFGNALGDSIASANGQSSGRYTSDDPLGGLIALNGGWTGVSAAPDFSEVRAMRTAGMNPMGLPTYSAATAAEGLNARNGMDVQDDLYVAQHGPGIASTRLNVRGDSTLEGLARQTYGDNWLAGMAAMKDVNRLQTNQWGSPLIYAGGTVLAPSLDGMGSDALGKLSAAGGSIESRNAAGLNRRAELLEAARQRSAQEATAVNTSGIADYRDPRDFQGSFEYRSFLSRRLSGAGVAPVSVAMGGTGVSAADALGIGWSKQGWSLLEHGPVADRSALASFAYGLGQGSRSLFDGLTGAGFMEQAQQSWNQPGQEWKAPLQTMQAIGAAGMTVFGAGELAALRNAGVSTMSARELAAVRATHVGDAESLASTATRPVPRVDVSDRFVKTRLSDGGFNFDYGDPTTHGLQASVSKNGTLSMDIRANAELAAAQGSGTDMAASLMNRLATEGIEVNSFAAQWMKGSKDVSVNYSYYNSMRYKVGDLEAARGTWTGQFFAKYGFDIVAPPVIVNSPGKIYLANFVKVPQ